MPLFFWAEAKAAEPSKDFASESSVSVSSATESLPFPSTSAVTRPGPSREEIGRATWTLLHSIASYYPEKPTRQQQKDVKRFVDSLTRLYPCENCQKHFQEIVKNDPPRCGSNTELQHWMCDLHNTVNRSLKKPTFNCSFLQARWGGVDCGTDDSCRVHFNDARHAFKNVR